MPFGPSQEPLRCRHCGDVIGTYEPMVALIEGEPRVTSRAAERDSSIVLGDCFHEVCYRDRCTE